ncbi:hypothetical protein RUND412_010851, partial [Rhizina undulata]
MPASTSPSASKKPESTDPCTHLTRLEAEEQRLQDELTRKRAERATLQSVLDSLQ